MLLIEGRVKYIYITKLIFSIPPPFINCILSCMMDITHKTFFFFKKSIKI